MSAVASDAPGTETDAAALLAKLRSFEGKPSGPPMEARDEVNQAMIRHWIDASLKPRCVTARRWTA